MSSGAESQSCRIRPATSITLNMALTWTSLPILRMRKGLNLCWTDADVATVTQDWQSTQNDLLLVISIGALFAAVAVIGAVEDWTIVLLLMGLALASLGWLVGQYKCAWIDGLDTKIDATFLRQKAVNWLFCWFFDFSRTMKQASGMCIVGMCSISVQTQQRKQYLDHRVRLGFRDGVTGGTRSSNWRYLHSLRCLCGCRHTR